MAEGQENGGILFGIRLDNSQLVKDVELSNKLFETIAKSAEETGKVVQHWFSDMQVVPKIDTTKFAKDINQVREAMAESSTKVGQGFNKAMSNLYINAGNAGAKVREESRQTVTNVSEDIDKLNGGFTAITGLAGKMFLGVSAGQIVNQMFQTRSYFQDAESSMKVFLGDAEKGEKFIKELKDYAFYNMFEFKDLVGASKQLISYGTAAKDVTGILDQLSNIATGTGANLNDMIGMYNKAKSVGRVDSQSLESWAARGVLVKETLKDMGETVTSTGVTFQQLEKVLAKVTGEGGMFHNLMGEQLNNLSASSAQLQDNLTAMWEEMGEKAEPYMKAAIDLAGTLIENYQGIADVVIDVAKVYGAYKLVDMSGLQDIIQQTEAETNLIETFKQHSEEIEKMMSADQAYAMGLSGLEEGTAEYAQAVKDMFETEKESADEQLKNIELVEQAETKRQQVLDANIAKKTDEIEKLKSEQKWKEVVAQKTELNTLQEQRNASAANMEAIAKQKASAAAAAKAASEKVDTLATMQNTTATTKASVATNLWSKAKIGLGKAASKLSTMLKETLLSNPYALAIAGAIALTQAIYNIIEAETARDAAQKAVDEAQSKSFKKSQDEIEKSIVPTLDAIKQLDEGTEEYTIAVNNLLKQYPFLSAALGDEFTKTDLLTQGYEALRDSIIKKNQASATETAIEENNAKVKEKEQEVIDEFTKQLSEQGIDALKARELGREFQKAIMDGMNFDELSDELKEVFANDTTLFANFSNVEGYWASVKQRILKDFGMDDNYQEYDSHLRALYEQLKRMSEAYDDVAKKAREATAAEMDNSVELERQAKENAKKAEEILNAPILKQYQTDLETIESQLKDFGKLNYLAWSSDKVANAGIDKKIKDLQAERRKLQGQIKQFNKDMFGLSYEDAQNQYKKQIDLYKSFAAQYTALEIKRQNEIKKLEDSRIAKGANQSVIDAQIAALNQRSDDELNTLFAKFYGVSGATANKVKEIFSMALNTPVDAAKQRMLEITIQLERIKDAAARGETIASKEQQAALAAEAAGLQQVINLANKAEDDRIVAMKRIADIEREHNDKSLSDEGRKQKAIKETYDTVRKELAKMLEEGQISQEQYEEVLFGINSDEMRESTDVWINAYGDFAAKREVAVREWWAKLKDVPAEYLNVAQEQMKKDLAEMDFEQFKKDIKWDELFDDMSKMSSHRLVSTISELQGAFELIRDDMTLEQIKEYEKAIEALNQQLAEKNPWKAIVSSIKTINATKSNLSELLKKEEEALTRKNKAQERYNKLLAQEKTIRANLENDKDNVDLQIELAETTEQIADAKNELTEATKEYAKASNDAVQEENKLVEANNNLYGSMSKIAGTLGQAGQAFSQLGDAMGDSGENMRELGSTLSSLGETFQSTLSAIQSGDKGSIIGSAVTNVVNMVSTIVASRKKYNEEQKQWQIAQEKFKNNMEISEIEKVRNQNKNSNIFYTDYNKQADDAAEAYRLAYDKLTNQIDKLSEEGKAKKGQRGSVDWGAAGKAAGSGAAAGAAIGSVIPGIGTAIGAVVGGVAGFIGGIFGGRKKKDMWGGLLEQFPELVEKGVDGEERINTALADQLIEQGMVNDKTKEMIESAKQYQEEMDAAKQQITEIVSELTGDMGNNIMDALVDAFKAGTDSAEAFGDTVDKVLENMIKKLIFDAAFSKYFDKLQKQYEDIFASGASETEKITMLMNATKEFKDEASAGVETMNEFMRQASEYGDSLGMNLFQEKEQEERKAVSGGIANVTQDTAEEMNGRLTQIQSHTFAINESCKQLTEFSSQQLTVLQLIHTDTGTLVRTVTAMKETIDDITIRGIKMKA
jgi:hypothetical protein